MTMHKPVMLREVLEYLDPKPNQNFIDCTFGGGGHATAILERIGQAGLLLAIDADSQILKNVKCQMSNVKCVNDNFRSLKSIYANNFPYPVSGILLDLGLSSMELDDETRGFSFLKDGPLDMRFDKAKQELTAGEVLNKYTLDNLVKIFTEYGEVPIGRARQVAKAVVETSRRRRMETSFDFVAVILQAFYPGAFARGKISVTTRDFYHHRKKITHPATQFFQALRVEVNGELASLKLVLPQAMDILETGGRLAVIAFHSLEDRIVKKFFKESVHGDSPTLRLLTKKPVAPTLEEIADNPRSRSAKLRVAEKRHENTRPPRKRERCGQAWLGNPDAVSFLSLSHSRLPAP